MGYTTEFRGELKFKEEPTPEQLAHLRKFLGKDRRQIGWGDNSKAYKNDGEYWYHIDLEFSDDFTGLRWNGTEKTYGLPDIINFLTDRMREKWPEFELTGDLFAQGESKDDMWRLRMEHGIAKKYPLTVDQIMSLPYEK